jgi:heat shock protein HslJ
MRKLLLVLSLVTLLLVATGCNLFGGNEAESQPPTDSTGTTDTAVTIPTPDTSGVATQSDGQVITLYVGPELVECVGVAPQMCMQVRLSPTDEYTYFYDTIQGFTFEPGYEYVLQVSVTQIPNPPADGSSLQYTLVSVVSQTPVGGTSTMPSSGQLTGVTWQWESFITPMGAASVPNPATFTVLFDGAGTVQALADCNTALGQYTATPNPDGSSGTIQMRFTLTTLAACPEGSLSEEFLANLEAVSNYTLVDGKLYLDLVAGAGTMILGTGNGTATQSAPPASSEGLVGAVWQWVDSNGQAVPNPQNYVVEFMADGSVAVKADCNNAFGTYSVDGGNISIMLGGMTMAMCPEGSLSDQFVVDLSLAQTWQRAGDQLTLGLNSGAGSMGFTAVP